MREVIVKPKNTMVSDDGNRTRSSVPIPEVWDLLEDILDMS